MVPSKLRTKGSAVFSSSRGGISCVLRATAVRADPKSVVDEGCQWVTSRIMGPEEVIEQLVDSKERTSSIWGRALEQQGGRMFLG